MEDYKILNNMIRMNNNKFGYNISIVDHNNEKWVRVQAMGEDFIIAPHDLTDAKGRVMTDRTQPELMERLEELGLTIFNRKQGFIIATLIDEINAKLEEIGADKLTDHWYVSSELWHAVGDNDTDGDSVWYFYGYDGWFCHSSVSYNYYRCRPVLVYDEKGGK